MTAKTRLEYQAAGTRLRRLTEQRPREQHAAGRASPDSPSGSSRRPPLPPRHSPLWSRWKESFCPPTDASYMSPPSAMVTMATPSR
jgi:hypothetical protein